MSTSKRGFLNFSRGVGWATPLLAALLAVACGDDGTTEDGAKNPNATAGDADGDTISDVDEGDGDPDGDGDPNDEDTDSDGDGIPDANEAGDADLLTAPVDSDEDGTPDFLDDDSDNNGISDAVEYAGGTDTDGDGVLDAHDLDNDGDGAADTSEMAGQNADCNGDTVPDPVGNAAAPQDCDADSKPNYLDTDSDGDNIPDSVEGPSTDTDKDGFLDRYDLDSDNDTLLDAAEAGDLDPSTPPIDTDEDGAPDYLDPDSDSDGLSDLAEAEAGTSPTNADSDGDGVSDLIEVAAGTDGNNAADNPQANGDFVFIVPYQEPTTPPDDTLEFRTSIQYADLYFSIDQTGSMGDEFNSLATNLQQVVTQLQCAQSGQACSLDGDCAVDNVCFNGQCIEDPNLDPGCVPDMWTGVGVWNDTNTYHNKVSLNPNVATTIAGVDAEGFPGGGEAVFQPPACVANPAACPSIPFAQMQCALSGIGCPGFRPEAIRIYFHVTDANNQCSGCTTFDVNYAAQQMLASDIKFVGLYGTDDCTASGGCTGPNPPQAQEMTALAIASDSLDAMGNAFVYPAADAQVVPKAVEAVLDLVKGKPIDVTIDPEDQPNDAGDSLQFISYLEVNTSGVGNCTTIDVLQDVLDGVVDGTDGLDDAFPDLLPGIPVCWNVFPVVENTTVQPTQDPQIFVAKLKVLGDGSLLDERDVYFLVPPDPAEIPDVPQ